MIKDKIDHIIKLLQELKMDINIDIGIESGGRTIIGSMELGGLTDGAVSKGANAVTATFTRTSAASEITIPVTVTGAASSVEGQWTDDLTNTHYNGAGTDYTITGTGVANQTNPSYNVTRFDLTFPAETTERVVTLTFRDNGVLQLDRTVYVNSLGFPQEIFTVVDPNIPTVAGHRNIIDVTDPDKDFDTGVAYDRNLDEYKLDNSGDVDNAAGLEAIAGYLKTNGGGILYFPDGNYDFIQANIPFCGTGKGITFVGQSKTGTLIRRCLPTLNADPHIVWVGQQNFGQTEGKVDSQPFTMANMTVDGRDLPPGLTITCGSEPDTDTHFYILQQALSVGDEDVEHAWVFVNSITGDGGDGSTGSPKQVVRSANMTTQAANLSAAMEEVGYLTYVHDDDATSLNAVWATDYYPNISAGYGDPEVPGDSGLTLFNFEMCQTIHFSNNVAAGYQTGARHIVNIENVHMQKCPGTDLFDIEVNTNSSWSWITEDDQIKVRGSISCTGQYSSHNFSNINAQTFHGEYTSAGNDGDAANYTANFYAVNSTWKRMNVNTSKGGYDVDSQTCFKNVTTSEFIGMQVGDAAGSVPTLTWPMRVTNCDFRIDSLSDCGVKYPVNAIYKDTIFRCDYTDTVNDYSIAWQLKVSQASLANLVKSQFDGCEFYFEDGATASRLVGVAGLGQPADYLQVEAKNCIFGTAAKPATWCVGYSPSGAGFEWILGPGNTYNCDWLGCYYSSASYPTRWKIDGTDCVFTNCQGMLMVYGSEVAGECYWEGFDISDDINLFDYLTSWSSFATNTTFGKISGTGVMRLITGEGAPVAGTTYGMKDAGGTDYDRYYDSVGEAYYRPNSVANRTWTAE